MAEDGELDAEVIHRVQSGKKNWKRVSGVLYDRRMNVKIKGKVYRTVVRPVGETGVSRDTFYFFSNIAENIYNRDFDLTRQGRGILPLQQD